MVGVWGCSYISWTICKQSAPHSRQMTTPTPHQSTFTGQMLFLAPNQQRESTEGKSTEGKMCWRCAVAGNFTICRLQITYICRGMHDTAAGKSCQSSMSGQFVGFVGYLRISKEQYTNNIQFTNMLKEKKVGLPSLTTLYTNEQCRRRGSWV